MGSLRKIRILSFCKIQFVVLTVLAITISTCSVDSATVSNTTTLDGRCDVIHVTSKYEPDILALHCSSYTEIPTNIGNPGAVTELYMKTANTIDILTSGSLIRSNLISLRTLNLEHCKIRVVEPGAFAGGIDIRTINLIFNLITVLNPDIFKDVPRLFSFFIFNNPISKIEAGKELPKFAELASLYINNCKLDTISANFFHHMENLFTLNLSGNKLTNFDWRVLQGIKRLGIIHLEANPWHCDCHIKFLMETLENMGRANDFQNITCVSAEMPKWKGHLWSEVPEEDMTCVPDIDKLVYTSWSPLSQTNKTVNKPGVTENMELGQNVYFDCEFSGFPKPEVRWFKDNHRILMNTNDSSLPSAPAHSEPKIEFLDDTPSTLNIAEQNDQKFNYKFREILVIRRIQEEDKGTYACLVLHRHATVRKEVTLSEIIIPVTGTRETPWEMWKWVALFIGLLLGVLIVAILVIVWVKMGQREERGIIEESRIDVGVFYTKQSNPSLKLEDSSLILL